MSAVIRTRDLSKWYGNVLGLADASVEIGSGIKGLLGPNGAGKSTFLKLITSQLNPKKGEVELFGVNIRQNREVLKRVGYVPEIDVYYPYLTGREFVRFIGELKEMPAADSRARAAELLEMVGLAQRSGDLVRTYSYGMRQRLRFAAALINDPELLILDEPLRGVDPFWRLELIGYIKKLSGQGRTVIVSSHILPEIEQLTEEIILIHQGKVLVQGTIHDIRQLLDNQPHRILVNSDRILKLAGELLQSETISSLEITAENEIVLQSDKLDPFFEKLAELIVELQLNPGEVTILDDNLQAVFDYLTRR